MKLIIALGNVGKEYEKTRHNIGFMVANQIIQKYNLSHSSSKFNGELFSGEIDSNKVLLIKPNTLMNLSGNSAIKVVNFYKISLLDVVVLHDDLDLDLGRVKLKVGGGSAGHNGIKSLDQNIGADYTRVRIGIARPANKDLLEVSDYVLGKFSPQELELVLKVSDLISKDFPMIISGDFNNFLNKYYQEIWFR